MFYKKILKPVVFVLLLALPVAFVYYTLRFSVHPHRIDDTVARLDKEIEKEDWESAAYTVKELSNKWQKVRTNIALNAGFDSLLDFEIALARLEKAVQERAAIEAQLELNTLRVIWREFITF